jgi:hypothetical protein
MTIVANLFRSHQAARSTSCRRSSLEVEGIESRRSIEKIKSLKVRETILRKRPLNA